MRDPNENIRVQIETTVTVAREIASAIVNDIERLTPPLDECDGARLARLNRALVDVVACAHK